MSVTAAVALCMCTTHLQGVQAVALMLADTTQTQIGYKQSVGTVQAHTYGVQQHWVATLPLGG